MADVATVEPSKVYSAFLKDFKELRGHYVYVNDVTNPTHELCSKYYVNHEQRKDAQKVVYEGEFITAYAKWEAFVQDFLEETREKLEPSLATVDVEKVGQRKYSPYFHTNAKRSINKYFAALFKNNGEALFENNDLTRQLLDWNSPIKAMCIINNEIKKVHGNGPDESPFLNIGDPNALESITRLFYGVRCVLAHSKCDRTMSGNGILSGFPSEEVFKEQLVGSDCMVSEQFYSLYKRADALYRKTTSLNHLKLYHCDVMNLQYFILKLASRLHNTVVRLIKEKYQQLCWTLVADHPPSKRKYNASLSLRFVNTTKFYGIMTLVSLLALDLIFYRRIFYMFYCILFCSGNEYN